uniref:Protein NLP3 n=1 Tax=Anthurium amnicola TaxID=1678845 RepID=A0A1D1YHM8_9ARAE
MDLDLDLDASWPFEPTVCLLSSSPLAVPPQQILLQLPHFAAPPSPPCLFDKAAVLAGALPEFSKFAAAGGYSIRFLAIWFLPPFFVPSRSIVVLTQLTAHLGQ